MTELQINSEHGLLSATILLPEHANCVLLLAHGAGADHKHVHMENLASAFAASGIATLRFNFPFKEQGRNRVDSKSVSVDCIVSAVETLKAQTALPVFVGGHSFGGRMVTHAVAENKIECTGLMLCSFPLHPAGKAVSQKAEERTTHFANIQSPCLFLSGTRDALASSDLLEQQSKQLSGSRQLHWLDTADHSFKTLKRSRKVTEDVYEEAAGVASLFAAGLL